MDFIVYSSTTPGDFDGDGILTIDDLTALEVHVSGETHVSVLDIDHDGLVDNADRRLWVTQLKNTWLGDANLDGDFNTSDLIDVLAAGTFEQDAEAGWASGDFDGSGRVDSSDLIHALADGGYEQGVRPALIAVPEPTPIRMLMIAAIGTAIIARSRRRELVKFCWARNGRT